MDKQPEALSTPPHASAFSRGAFSLWLLLLIYAFNFLDRQVVNILAEPIKQELGLKDWQLGLLTGLSFALLYTVLGIPIARLADRANRVWIISGAVALWSLFTVVCGLAGNFTQLLLARVGVGVGEAGCSPPAHSLISDYVPRERRASALAFYAMGIPLGSLAGMALGGLVADAYGWRVAFFVAGAPGLVLALLALATLREPRRSGTAGMAAAEAPGLAAVTAELASRRSFWFIASASALAAFASYGHAAFLGSYYFRNHGAELARLASGVGGALGAELGAAGFLGTTLGLVFGLAGATGTYLGGRISDLWARRNAASHALVPAMSSLAAAPFLFIALSAPGAVSSMALLVAPMLLNAVWYGPVFASVQGLVQPRTRATAAAVLLFVLNLIGLGLGPLTLGAVSDYLAQSMGAAQGVRWALISSGVVNVLAALLFWLGSRRLKEELVS
jgi:MFS family permease